MIEWVCMYAGMYMFVCLFVHVCMYARQISTIFKTCQIFKGTDHVSSTLLNPNYLLVVYTRKPVLYPDLLVFEGKNKVNF